MKIGDRVIVHAKWSSFHDRCGVVTSVDPHVWVLLEGERLPMRLGECALLPEEESGPLPLTGAE